MKKFISLVVIAVVIVLAFVFKSDDRENSSSQSPQGESGQMTERQTGVKIGNLAPEFSLKDYEGREVKLSDFKGRKPVFLNFWASWCPFCVDELPLMAQVQEKYKDQYVTVAVNRAEDLETAKKFSDSVNVSDKMVLLLDPKDKTYKDYRGFAMPYSLFIDKDGIIRDIKLGPLSEAELEVKIKKIIQ